MRGDIQLTNPANRFFKWSGSTGKLSYYDKETEENVEVETPFTFLVLETYTTFKGFDKAADAGIYSNEVKDTTKQLLNVRSGKNTIEIGLYQDIKAAVVAKGGKYASSVYVAYKNEVGKLVIGNITFSGSSFGGGVHVPDDKKMKDIEIPAWLDFSKKYATEILAKAVVLEGKDERICTNGNTKFYAPKFKLKDITPETDAEAIALTQILKEYMTAYFAKTQSEIVAETPAAETEESVKAKIEESIKKQFGGTTENLTATEKAFMVKPEVEDAAPNMGGNLPGEEESSFVDFNPDDDSLPF